MVAAQLPNEYKKCGFTETGGEPYVAPSISKIPWLLGGIIHHANLPLVMVASPVQSKVIFSIASYSMYLVYKAMKERIHEWLERIWLPAGGAYRPPYDFNMILKISKRGGGEAPLISIGISSYNEEKIPLPTIGESGRISHGIASIAKGRLLIFRNVRKVIRKYASCPQYDFYPTKGKGVVRTLPFNYSVLMPPPISSDSDENERESSRLLTNVGIILLYRKESVEWEFIKALITTGYEYAIYLRDIRTNVPSNAPERTNFLIDYLVNTRQFFENKRMELEYKYKLRLFGRIIDEKLVNNVNSVIYRSRYSSLFGLIDDSAVFDRSHVEPMGMNDEEYEEYDEYEEML